MFWIEYLEYSKDVRYNNLFAEKRTVKDMLRNENTDYLFKAILNLQDVEECYRFFEDICTADEVKEMARRMRAAKMLYHNYVYSTIAEDTGLSTATISRVSRCLKYGNGGYYTVLDRIEKK